MASSVRNMWCWSCEEFVDTTTSGNGISCSVCSSGAIEERDVSDMASFVPPRIVASREHSTAASSATAQALSGSAAVAAGASSASAAEETAEADLSAALRRLLIRRILLSLLEGGQDDDEDEDGGTDAGDGSRPGTAGSAASLEGGMLAAFLGGGTLVSGDYVIGDLAPLLARLASLEAGSAGPPGTSSKVVEALPRVKQGELQEGEECTICQEVLTAATDGEGPGCTRLPGCRHAFHLECIVPWLQTRNVCPVCRSELPSTDAEFNAGHGLDVEAVLRAMAES